MQPAHIPLLVILVVTTARSTLAAAAPSRPRSCPRALADFACGEDGVTYQNYCLAAAQGVKVARSGRCDQQLTLFAKAPDEPGSNSNGPQLTSEDISRYASDGFRLAGVAAVGAFKPRATYNRRPAAPPQTHQQQDGGSKLMSLESILPASPKPASAVRLTANGLMYYLAPAQQQAAFLAVKTSFLAASDEGEDTPGYWPQQQQQEEQDDEQQDDEQQQQQAKGGKEAHQHPRTSAQQQQQPQKQSSQLPQQQKEEKDKGQEQHKQQPKPQHKQQPKPQPPQQQQPKQPPQQQQPKQPPQQHKPGGAGKEQLEKQQKLYLQAGKQQQPPQTAATAASSQQSASAAAALLLEATATGRHLLSAAAEGLAAVTPPQAVALASLYRSLRKLQYIIGKDDRSEIAGSPKWPFTAVGQFVYVSGTCSGVMISTRAVLTAGHCVYSRKKGLWQQNIMFIPARHRKGNRVIEPFGRIPFDSVTAYSGWVDNANTTDAMKYDIAVVRLANESVGLATGWLGVTWDKRGYKGEIFSIGYPGDKMRGTQWMSVCNVTDAQGSDSRFVNSCDVWPGQSGSPMMEWRLNEQYYMRAVLSYESCKCCSPDCRCCDNFFNGGCAINALHYANILRWR